MGKFSGELPDCADLQNHLFFETSGTGGEPKWIALSKDALLASAEAVNLHLDVCASSRWGLALPVHHVGGFGVAARAFAAGCAFHEFEARWQASAFAGWISAREITHTSLVPTQVFDLVAAGLKAPCSLRAIVVGGGHLDVGTGRAARALGWPVLASYGMTEAASQIATQELHSLASIYQPVPIPLLPVWRAGVSADSTLRIAGPALFSGTLLRENGVWTFIRRSSEWYQTSDRVELESRNLTPAGRTDMQVKVLGELVSLEDIERELVYLSDMALPPSSFAVVAIPDPRRGNILVPVFEQSVDRMLVESVINRYALTAPGYKRLQPPRRIEKLPRGPLGKVQRAGIVPVL